MHNTVRVQTHALCKSTHFFFPLFTATMSNSFQTYFSSVVIDLPAKYNVCGPLHGHLQGQTCDNKNTRF